MLWYIDFLTWIGAIGVAAIMIVTFVARSNDKSSRKVEIYREGVLAFHWPDFNPLSTKRNWFQLPWENIVHIDLKGNAFSILYIGQKLKNELHGLQPLSKGERKRILEELKSFQQRGDIPATVRILEK